MSQLTPKQRRFVEHYLQSFDKEDAARRAGYDSKRAAQRGAELLRQPRIQAALRSGETGPATTIEITPDRILQELGKIAFVNMGDYFCFASDGTPYIDLQRLTEFQWAAVQEVSFDTQGRAKIRNYDKKGALIELGKHFGLFNPRQVHDVHAQPARALSDEELDARINETIDQLDRLADVTVLPPGRDDDPYH